MALEHSPLIDRDRSHLVIIDVQARLLPAMAEPDAVVANIDRLIKGAEILGVPYLITEQYPKGLGVTVGELRSRAAEDNVIEKIHFSAYRERAFRERVIAGARRQLILTGIEAHVCVLQTALDAVAAGHQVFLVDDAVSSRAPHSKSTALARMRPSRSRGCDHGNGSFRVDAARGHARVQTNLCPDQVKGLEFGPESVTCLGARPCKRRRAPT